MSNRYSRHNSKPDYRSAIIYHPIGNGRDSYISVNNGGSTSSYVAQGVPQLGSFMKFGSLNRTALPTPSSHTRRYNVDGTGRDTYVCSRDKNPQIAANVKCFQSTLRQYSRKGRRVTLRTEHSPESRDNNKSVHQVDPFANIRIRNLSIPKKKTQKFQSLIRSFKTQPSERST